MDSLTYYKFFEDDAVGLESILTETQYGVFMKYFMRYGRTFEKETLPPEYITMQLLYEFFCEKVNGAKVHYDKKVEQNAENGSKGGTQKAENAKRKREQQDPAPFSLSTAEINDLYNDLYDELSEGGEVKFTKREFKSFLNQLYKNNWYVGNKQLQTPEELRKVVPYRIDPIYFSTALMGWNIYCEYISLFDDSFSFNDDVDFYGNVVDSYYNECKHVWTVDGKVYPEKDYKKVLSLLKERLLANLAKT